MLNIANAFDRNLQEVHTIFYEVSCNRDKLIEVLDHMKKKEKSNKDDKAPKVGECQVSRWQTLQDLALRNTEDTPSF